ncbi:hypothetical protein HO133_006851 [Letharia lupina]|uniref:Uncharacterized protein n=1 Tax=Letharia lupina TaxID=560253 RepID=A0A8H6C5A1_9LECA|nr:uncharacterized protein HO133_006851 [Letharia lupina]KAF6217513.1 hypothetical protein HO133_006851 [Letharia lupina]
MPVFQFLTIAAGFMVLVSAGRIGNRQGDVPIFTCAKTCLRDSHLRNNRGRRLSFHGCWIARYDVLEDGIYLCSYPNYTTVLNDESTFVDAAGWMDDYGHKQLLQQRPVIYYPESITDLWTLSDRKQLRFLGVCLLSTPIFPLRHNHANILLGPEMDDEQYLTASSSINGFENDEVAFNGCNCVTTWGPVPTSSLQISQSGFGGPGYCGGPICEVSPSTIPVGQSTRLRGGLGTLVEFQLLPVTARKRGLAFLGLIQQAWLGLVRVLKLGWLPSILESPTEMVKYSHQIKTPQLLTANGANKLEREA